MPNLIFRKQAVSEIEKQISKGECLVCSLVKRRKNLILFQNRSITVLLSEFPRTWGQIMILLNEHKTLFSELSSEEWKGMSDCIQKAALAVEKVLRPLRVYVAGTGSVQNLPMTCPHIHFNVIPVYNEEDKPSSIFTWENGLYSGTDEEWRELFEKLILAF